MNPKLPRKIKKAFKKSFPVFDIFLASVWKSSFHTCKGYKAYILGTTGYVWKIEKGEFIKMHPNEIYGCMKNVKR